MRSPFKKRSTPTASTASQSPSETQRSRTEEIAYELYQTRQLLNRSGDTHTDWVIAERIVQSRMRLTLYRCHRPFIRLEKNTWEPLLAWANNQALLSLLGLVGNIGLIIAVATYIGSEKQRRNAEVLNAWQTITNADGQAGSGGRIQALEFLNASPGANWRRKFPWFCAPSSICLWDAESLDGINLSIEDSDNVVEDNRSKLPENFPAPGRGAGVYLRAIQLPRVSLGYANLEGADLRAANLEGAGLGYANLQGAGLGYANLEGADLRAANLEGTDLRAANLEGADLRAANLEGTDLRAANLEGADLRAANLEGADFGQSANLVGADLRSVNLEGVSLLSANLEEADLGEANLAGADLLFANLAGADLRSVNLERANLRTANLAGTYLLSANLERANLRTANLTRVYWSYANLEGADLSYANLEGGRKLTTERLTQAKLCRTRLPEGIDLSPDRDCEELGLLTEP